MLAPILHEVEIVMNAGWTRGLLAALALLVLVTATGHLLAGQSAPLADQQVNRQSSEGDESLAQEIADAVSGSLFYTMFDDVDVRVADGVATLTGVVTASSKSKEFTKLASQVRGIQRVVNRIETLPNSTMDDALRAEIAVKIYRSPAFSDHAKQRVGPLHIIVRDGQVTLTGVVDSEVERRTAEMIARQAYGTWSVDNQLRLKK
jgi:hyperosmotically inducible protein